MASFSENVETYVTPPHTLGGLELQAERPQSRFYLEDVRNIALFGLAYLASYAYGALFSQITSAPLWLPDSIFLCALLLVPTKKWWLYILAAAPIRFLPGLRPPAPDWFIWATFLNDAVKAMLGAYLLRSVTGNFVRFNTVKKYTAYLGIAVLLVPFFSAFFGAAARRALGYAFWPAFGQWFLGDALTNIVATPTLLVWFSGEYRRLRARMMEGVLWGIGFALCLTYIVFKTRFNESLLALYAPVPFLLWAVTRLGAVGASTGISLTTLFLMLRIAPAHASSSSVYLPAQDVHFVQIFLAIMSSALLFVAILLEERESIEEHLRLGVEAGKCVGWDWDIKTGEDRWFGDLGTVFGISSDTFSGKAEDFLRRVYPDDREVVSKAMAYAQKNRKPYVAEFRVIRNDSAVRWISARGQFQYAANGHPVRMLGMAVDITERKMAEETLGNLSGRLIEAQEEERKRVAREIHDDYQQRLAMVAIDLEKLTENSPVEVRERVQHLCNEVKEIGANLHSLSHRLHSSTLARLGLIAGVAAFCEEFSQQQNIQIDFAHENVPSTLPADVALCLFRITQEGLRNIKKHSGVDRAEVRLESLDGKLCLSISDHGKGFDPNVLSPESGIGIRSMEERLRWLGGKLRIQSRLMEGTHIEAAVPLKADAERSG